MCLGKKEMMLETLPKYLRQQCTSLRFETKSETKFGLGYFVNT